MNILGLNCYRHDSSACLVKDDEVVTCVQEDRFNRKKHYGGFPAKAIAYALEKAGISFSDISLIGFFCRPWYGLFKRIPSIIRYLPSSINWSNEYSGSFWAMINIRGQFKKVFKVKKIPKIYFVEHHLAHMAGVFFTSSFDKAAILSFDAAGECHSTVMGFGEKNKISVFHKIALPNSLGYFYNAICQYLGFRHFDYGPDDAEGKVMALASYGQPRYLNLFSRMLIEDKDGSFVINLKYFEYQLGKKKYFSSKLEEILGPRRLPGQPITQRHMDIAASLQSQLEIAVLRLTEKLYKITKINNLCLAGGVALNCVMNTKILQQGLFKNIFIYPDAGDAGTALGSALYIHHIILDRQNRLEIDIPFLGPAYNNDECERALLSSGLSYKYYEDITSVGAGLLAEGKILGWVQGQLECGPRALGNRSILADPRNPEMKDKLNRKVKFREAFRPFAPSVLEEKAREYFEIDPPFPFMLFAVKIRDSKRHLIPAVLHIDDSARLQTVNRETNPTFWALLKRFEELTGIPILLNTSFNIKGEPIVNSPQDAINCFQKTRIDALILGNFVVEKPHL